MIMFAFCSFSNVLVVQYAPGILLDSGIAVTGEEGRHCSQLTARQTGKEVENSVGEGDTGWESDG